MIDIKGPEGKVRFRFFHKAWSSYEDEDENIGPMTLETWYEADTWQEAAQDAADSWDWDDEEVVNFDAESERIETCRDFISMEYLDSKGEYQPVPEEVEDWFDEAEQKSQDDYEKQFG